MACRVLRGVSRKRDPRSRTEAQSESDGTPTEPYARRTCSSPYQEVKPLSTRIGHSLRKTEEAIEIAHRSLRRKASKKGGKLQPRTLEFARYVILFTTFPVADFPIAEVLEWYRIRW